MNTIEFKNKDLAGLYNTIDSIIVSAGRARRGKGKLLKNIAERVKEFNGDTQELYSEYFELENDGKIKVDDKNKFIVLKGKSESEAQDKNKELVNEMAVIELVTFEEKIKAFYNLLVEDKFNVAEGKTLSDVHYDTLMDELENVFEGGE